ncbi:baseplate hub subunit and tail lysozyme [Synechococcus phage S-CREM2]|nr:baseplate hub subunit and tail lysozyme [Synechococcus phage S-CREM2]
MPFDPEGSGLSYGVEWIISNRLESGLLERFPEEIGDAWTRVFINPDSDTIMNGYRVDLRGFVEGITPATTNPATGVTTPETVVYGYGAITRIDSLTITCTQKDGDLFTEPDRLFVDTTVTAAPFVGILDGSYYQWDKVFDRSRVKYIEGLDAETPLIDGADVEVEELGLLPKEPYDISVDPEVYPMDIFTSIRPDTRPKVTLTYTATFVGQVEFFPYSETVTWTQEVWQKAYDWEGYVGDALGNYTYFVNGDTSDKRAFPEGYPATNPEAQ